VYTVGGWPGLRPTFSVDLVPKTIISGGSDGDDIMQISRLLVESLHRRIERSNELVILRR